MTDPDDPTDADLAALEAEDAGDDLDPLHADDPEARTLFGRTPMRKRLCEGCREYAEPFVVMIFSCQYVGWCWRCSHVDGSESPLARFRRSFPAARVAAGGEG